MGAFMPILETCTVLGNAPESGGIHRLLLASPLIAEDIRGGQFIHLGLPSLEAHILRRPISVYAADAQEGTLELIYQAIGDGTRWLARAGRGTELDAIGPLGRGWQPPKETGSALIIAGGVGLAPLNMLVDTLVKTADVQLLVGAQSADRLVLPSTRESRVAVTVTTDDGSKGSKGFVTDLARRLLETSRFDYIATCGPEPMQRIVVALAEEFDVPCEVSLERRMACGIGACLSCVVQTVEGGKRVCVDGPVFDAREVVW
jgi:dihydroorotate dehydrogenase electron transfer subunit